MMSSILAGCCLVIGGCEKAANDESADPTKDDSAMTTPANNTITAKNPDLTDNTKTGHASDAADATAMKPPPPGDVAPDIVGVDLDGVEFKLSDYKGKVIFLDFWGDW